MAIDQHKSRETRLRRTARRAGFRIAKTKGRVHLDNLGEYMLISERENAVVMGARYDADLDQIEAFLSNE